MRYKWGCLFPQKASSLHIHIKQLAIWRESPKENNLHLRLSTNLFYLSMTVEYSLQRDPDSGDT